MLLFDPLRCRPQAAVGLLSVKVRAAPGIRRSQALDLAAVRQLLSEAHLPTEDLANAPGLHCRVLEAGDEVLGVIGLQCADGGALVRSLAVAPPYRGQGWGRQLLATLERDAYGLGIQQLVLLTETAQAFFAAQGYAVVDRTHVPEELQQTAEFRSLCPASAICMTKLLEGVNG